MKEQKQNIIKNEASNNEKWETIKDADFIRFEEVGDSLEGTIVGISNSERYGFGMYTIETETGVKRFHGSTQLDDLLCTIKINDYILIELTDRQKTDKGMMNIFNVKRRRK